MLGLFKAGQFLIRYSKLIKKRRKEEKKSAETIFSPSDSCQVMNLLLCVFLGIFIPDYENY